MTRRLLAGVQGTRRLDLAEHRRVHGDVSVRPLETLLNELTAAQLLGRGGAGFPVAKKLQGMRRSRKNQVLVNGSEGEPASWKDRWLMRLTPHLIIDGAELMAHALGTRHITIVIEDQDAWVSMSKAVAERGSRDVELVRAPGVFVGGEIRSVMQHVEGRPAMPPGRGRLPTVDGLFGAPTFGSNVETFAQIAVLASLGVQEFCSVGDPLEPGTSLVTVWGDTPVSGLLEVPTGTALVDLVGQGSGPVLVGGYHGTWLPDVGNLTLTRPTLRERGAPLGAGVLARLPDTTCALKELAAVAKLLADSSAGQCGPCAFGLPAVAENVAALAQGVTPRGLGTRLDHVSGRGACAHPTAAVGFIRSGLIAFADEVRTHQQHGHCGRHYEGVLRVSAAPQRRSYDATQIMERVQ